MTEYWKSNARKYCDYCKCWFADNKPSIEFHEAGKKHKENVAKRLQEIGKKGRQDYENSLKADEYMRQMEQAALRAYKADIDANPDMTGNSIAVLAKEKNADIVIKSDCKEATEKTKNTKWRETISSDGRSYYFHTETKETKWEVPKEGFISIEEHKAVKNKKKKTKTKKDNEESKKKKLPKHDTNKTMTFAQSPAVKSSKTSARDAYGLWTPVQKPVLPDLQLPTKEGPEPAENSYSLPKPTAHQFTEKTVTLSGASTSSDFKKRKNTHSFKKNARMRTDDL